MSLSARRAWIEIPSVLLMCSQSLSLSARRAWIEIIPTGTAWYMIASLSARRAWIEIYCFDTYTIALRIVALRKESVARNCDSDPVTDKAWAVALRKESVDRNPLAHASHTAITGRSPQGEHGMFLFLTVQGGFVHADIRFNFKNCYSKKLSHKII